MFVLVLHDGATNWGVMIVGLPEIAYHWLRLLIEFLSIGVPTTTQSNWTFVSNNHISLLSLFALEIASTSKEKLNTWS